MKIAVIPNPLKEGTESIASSVLEKFPKNCFLCEENTDITIFDVAVVLGGDGTILRAVKNYPDIPILGINFGTLGFMASSEKDGAVSAIERVLSGNYKIEERMMLKAAAYRNDEIIAEGLALNDGVIIRGERILSLRESFNEKLVYSFSGDGLIVATPTGSTAYSLSAGGPVAPPDMEVIITTPVCPHSIHIRPVVASGETNVTVQLTEEEGNSGVLSLDGQNITHLEAGDKVTFCRADKKAKLLSLTEKNFYDILRYKLSAVKGE